MLFEPFEEQFNLPSILIEIGHLKSRQRKVVGQKRELPGPLLIPKPHQTQVVRIVFSRIKSSQFNGRIRKDILGKSAFLFDRFELEALLCPDHEIGFDCIDFIQPLKVVISTVKHIVRALFIWDYIHSIHIVDGSRGDMEESRNLRFYIIKGMDFNTCLLLILVDCSEGINLIKVDLVTIIPYKG